MNKPFITIALIAGIVFFVKPAYSRHPVDSTAKAHTVVVHNLGSRINSTAEDFGPYLVGKSMMFSRQPSASSKFDQFWVTKRKSQDSGWGKPEYVNSLNNKYAVGSLSMDDSGKIYFASNNQTDDVNIWVGTIKDRTMHCKPLPSPVNSEYWECEPSVSANGRDLYFASNHEHPGMSGKRVDIFITHRIPGGGWTQPQNLGPHINFGNYNATPFITPDGSVLFFSSDGKTDSKKKIYMAMKTGPNDQDWSDPILLPSDINAEGGDNMYPMIAPDGKTFYFSSNRPGGYGGLDLYQATLPQAIQNMLAHSTQ
ncbi:MAG: hypothetical protein Q8896_00710 [Bacteroidota bacterium]|nr:hypothetical protein [Bacteroidota bacterium]